jgi:hypothetical protein
MCSNIFMLWIKSCMTISCYFMALFKNIFCVWWNFDLGKFFLKKIYLNFIQSEMLKSVEINQTTC